VFAGAAGVSEARGRLPNKGMHQTRSALPTTVAALAGDPWCWTGLHESDRRVHLVGSQNGSLVACLNGAILLGGK